MPRSASKHLGLGNTDGCAVPHECPADIQTWSRHHPLPYSHSSLNAVLKKSCH